VAADVNENLQALATAIQGIKSISLYQNNVKIGKSLLLTLIKLNSGYVTMVSKDHASANIYLKNGARDLFYASNNCTGTMYVPNTLKTDLISGEMGVVTGAGDNAIFVQIPSTPTANFWYNSLKHDGVCRDVSAYVTPSQQDCIDNNWNAFLRVKEVDMGGYYDCQWLAWSGRGTEEEILAHAYPVQLNNPAVTGISTTACVNGEGKTAVCVTNGELRSE
jgi:hypothetical protein